MEGPGLSIGNGGVEHQLNTNAIIEEVSAMGDNFLTLFDSDNSSMVLKGVIDQQGGAVYLDPSQFANLIMDETHVMDGSGGLVSITCIKHSNNRILRDLYL